MPTDFDRKVEETVRVYEQLIGHAASRTRTMLQEHGSVKALSRLMVSADLQQGFKVLRDTGQLDQSFEALVVKNQHLFDSDAIEAAQWRLDNADELL